MGLDPPFTVNMAVRGTNLYVFGSFTNIGGIPRGDLAKLSTLGSGQVDTSWSPEGFPDLGFVIIDYNGLAVRSDALFVNWINFDDLTAGVIKLDAGGTGAMDTNWSATLDRSPGLLHAGPFGLFAAGNFRLCNDQVSLSLAKL